MGIFGYLLSLLATIIIGGLLLRLLVKGKVDFFYCGEYITYSFILGVIIIPFVLFIANLIGVSFSSWNVSIIVLLLVVILCGVNFLFKEKFFFKKIEWTEIKKISIYKKILFIIGGFWIILKLCFGLLSISQVPTYQDDTFGNWNFRAKVFYERESLVLDKNDPDFLGQGFKQYPLTPSLYKTYLMKSTGYWHEGLVNIPSFLFFVSALFLIFFSLLRTTNIQWSFLGVFLLTGIPLFYIHGTNPYFDIFQGVYLYIPLYFLFLLLTIRYKKSENEDRIILLLFFVFTSLLGLTKSEGLSMLLPMILFFSFIVLIYLFFSRGKRFRRNSFVGLFSLSIPVSFILFKIIKGLGFGNGNAAIGSFDIMYNPLALKTIINVLYLGGSFSIFFPILFFLIFYFIYKTKFNIKKHSDIYFLIISTLLLLITNIILMTFVVSLHKEAISQTGINRIFIQLTLSLLFLGVYILYYILSEKKYE